MTSANSGLRIDRLAMNFGGVFVFEDVSIDIPPGKVTACIGPNGAGKTTIINIVCGVFPPRPATSTVDGVRLAGVRPVRHRPARPVPQLPGRAHLSVSDCDRKRAGRHAEPEGRADRRVVSSARARTGARQPRPRPSPAAGRRARKRGRAAGRRIAVRPAEALVAPCARSRPVHACCCSTSRPPASKTISFRASSISFVAW